MTWHGKYCLLTPLEKLIMHVMAQHVVLQKEIILTAILVICLSSWTLCFDDPPLSMDFPVHCYLKELNLTSFAACICLGLY